MPIWNTRQKARRRHEIYSYKWEQIASLPFHAMIRWKFQIAQQNTDIVALNIMSLFLWQCVLLRQLVWFVRSNSLDWLYTRPD